MKPELKAIAAHQAGLVTRLQASVVGYRDSEIRLLTSPAGAWVRVRNGVYMERTRYDEAAQDWDGAAALGDRAAHLRLQVPHMMSHDSAARAWGLPMLRARCPLVHVTRAGLLGTRTSSGIKHHLTRFDVTRAEQCAGLMVTGLARTSLDLAREHGFECGVVAVDGARQRGVSVDELRRELAPMKHWPHVVTARLAVEASDSGAESPGESLTRVAAIEAGLSVTSQFPIRLPNAIAWVDLIAGRHVIEFDGRGKFRRVEVGGFADRSMEDVLWSERTRQNAINSLGFGVSRVAWDDLMGNRRAGTILRLKAEHAQTCSRWGSELTSAEREFAERHRGDRVKAA